jgi:hypothetical protein
MEKGHRADEPPSMSEYTFSGPEQKSVTLNDYKYIYTEDPDERKLGVGYRNIPKHAVFNLKEDPGETNNIYDTNKELASEYHAILEATLSESREIKSRLKASQRASGSEAAKLPQDVVDSLEDLGYLK